MMISHDPRAHHLSGSRTACAGDLVAVYRHGDGMKKHCARRHYVPGTLLLPQQRDAIVLPAHIALDAIEIGGGDIIHRHTLAAFLNIVATCAARMVGAANETRQMLDDAKYALVSADRRFIKTGRWGFTGPEMLTLRAAVTVADELLKRTNSGVLTYAVDFVSRANATSSEVLGTCKEPLAEAA
jgi:hypothetical protein